MLSRAASENSRQVAIVGSQYRSSALIIRSSGMCKAGFAGDDAPRAVFRESQPGTLAAIKRLHLGIQFADALGSFHCW